VTRSEGTVGAEYSYDAAGRVVRIANANAVLEYEYDRSGRLVKEIETVEGRRYEVSYGWDTDGRPAGLGYPSGWEVGYRYGARGLIDAIQVGDQTVAGYIHDAKGRRVLLARGNGVQTVYEYDGRRGWWGLRM
jgi:YD repeat-containing protein